MAGSLTKVQQILSSDKQTAYFFNLLALNRARLVEAGYTGRQLSISIH
ncbi:hypothetical protein RV15_GL001896 [Enterococcus silesiacus]|uniref:Uncharacterized protein n=1 Tax=Enterococcus silesiacus TaxID=332949 RepID=A0AA91G7N2_9ENTE|nr:hypothetical protein RV15_GL001896 [Enterococcus silesiacus]